MEKNKTNPSLPTLKNDEIISSGLSSAKKSKWVRRVATATVALALTSAVVTGCKNNDGSDGDGVNFGVTRDGD